MTTTYVSDYAILENLIEEARAEGSAKTYIDDVLVEYWQGEFRFWRRGEDFFAHSLEEALELLPQVEELAAARIWEEQKWERETREHLHRLEREAVEGFLATGEWNWDINYSDIYKDLYGVRPRNSNEYYLELYREGYYS